MCAGGSGREGGGVQGPRRAPGQVAWACVTVALHRGKTPALTDLIAPLSQAAFCSTFPFKLQPLLACAQTAGEDYRIYTGQISIPNLTFLAVDHVKHVFFMGTGGDAPP